MFSVNIVTKTFIKKNKVGNYLKTVREHYIRDDISCGFKSCETCFMYTESNLGSKFKNESTLFETDPYLILDTNVILDQIDILEEPVLGNVIILHTVLKEVKHRSMPTYRRLCTILGNTSRNFYVFVNDHHRDTFLEQDARETANDYNDRCIRKACVWYIKHLPDIQFVLLSDDRKNRELAQMDKIPTVAVSEYVSSLKGKDAQTTLGDKLSRKDFHSDKNEKNIFPCHLSTGDVLQGIKDGRLLQGTFRASRDNFLEGFVDVEGYELPIIVQGRKHLNRAVNGDRVGLELLKKDEWVAPSDLVVEDTDDMLVDPATVDDLEKQLLNRKRKSDMVRPTGRVVAIIKRNWRNYCGILAQSPDNPDGLYQLFVPAEKSIPKIRIETRQASYLKTQKIIVAIDSWPQSSRYPHGHFIRALGQIGDASTENEVILLEHDVPHGQFSEEVLACLPKTPWLISEQDTSNRVDIRHLNVCSVDPPGCTDIDDALHCREIDENTLEVGVHIADVSHFIRPGTALDIEAALRATTVYLVNNRIDMVPALLSSNLCSLMGNQERFAFSCIWDMDHNANILRTRFHKSIIRSRSAMTYEEAQMRIDDTQTNDAIAKSLRHLLKLSKILKQRRLENGALVLASPEVKIYMDSETMEPLDVQVKKLFETNSMIEEFMLLANISVAERILEEFPGCAMLRRHPEPPATNFEPLVKAGRHLGFDIETDCGKNLAKSLDNAESSENPYLNTMLRILATRCMLQAVYFASGMFQYNEYYHYGLAVPLYTHFTSPIRRYADIIVHRLLAVICGADSSYPDLLDKHKTNKLCENLNYRNRMAQYAGRASVAFNTHLFFKNKEQDAEGYILFIRKNALQILLPRYGLECTLYLAAKGEESTIFEYNEENQTQIGPDNVVFHAFDPVIVRIGLNSDNIQHQKLSLKLVKPYVKGFSVETESSEEGSSQPKRKRSNSSKRTPRKK